MNDLVAVALVGAIPATIAALASWRNGRKIDVVHEAVNGGLATAKAEIVALKAEVLRLKQFPPVAP